MENKNKNIFTSHQKSDNVFFEGGAPIIFIRNFSFFVANHNL
jgi:hypothetical protein